MKEDEDSRNALEKIIKLDRKNSNFDLYDPLTKYNSINLYFLQQK